MEKRDSERARKRVMVRYGVDSADRMAFTKNLSAHGLHIQTNAVIAPGTRIRVELKFPQRTFSMWAQVVWAKKVPPQLAHTLPCGMGLRFLDVSEEWLDFFGSWSGKKVPGRG